jgi:hypothetical protein
MSKKTIGFFGDSFCKSMNIYDKTTYIDMVADDLDLEVVNLGVAGSSIEDAILIQFENFISANNVPDICVFLWTDSHRLFNRNNRNLNGGSISRPTPLSETISAAKNYYAVLYDYKWHELRHRAILYYFNKVLLSQFPDKKILNLWSFGEAKQVRSNDKETFTLDNIVYPCRFSRGVEIRPALVHLSVTETEKLIDLGNDVRPNHLEKLLTNKRLASVIIDGITNYEDGKLLEINLGDNK